MFIYIESKWYKNWNFFSRVAFAIYSRATFLIRSLFAEPSPTGSIGPDGLVCIGPVGIGPSSSGPSSNLRQ